MNQPVPNVVRIRFGGDLDLSGKDRLAELLAPAILADIVILDLAALIR